MSDFDHLSDAVDRVARDTVAPPFASVEHRARARRHRQVAGTAAGVAAVVAVATLVAPAAGGRASRTPFTSTGSTSPSPRPDGELVVRDENGDPTKVLVLTPETTPLRCGEPPEPGAPGVRTLAEGESVRHAWFVVAWTGDDGARCVSFRTEPGTDPLTPDSSKDTGPAGDLDPKIRWDFFEAKDGGQLVLHWGAVAPEVVRIEHEVNGRTQRFDTIPAGDRAYVAYALHVPPDGRETAAPVGYDKDGNEVPLPTVTP